MDVASIVYFFPHKNCRHTDTKTHKHSIKNKRFCPNILVLFFSHLNNNKDKTCNHVWATADSLSASADFEAASAAVVDSTDFSTVTTDFSTVSTDFSTVSTEFSTVSTEFLTVSFEFSTTSAEFATVSADSEDAVSFVGSTKFTFYSRPNLNKVLMITNIVS